MPIGHQSAGYVCQVLTFDPRISAQQAERFFHGHIQHFAQEAVRGARAAKSSRSFH
jgi:hypothetical protein